jgi:hypothetical protein
MLHFYFVNGDFVFRVIYGEPWYSGILLILLVTGGWRVDCFGIQVTNLLPLFMKIYHLVSISNGTN